MASIAWDPPLKTPTPWEGGRNYTQDYEDDEGTWNGSWTFRRIVVAARALGHAHHVYMVCRVGSTLFGSAGHLRRRGRSCSVYLEWDGQTAHLARLRCTSLVDAQRIAARCLYFVELRAMYRRVYGRDEAVCVYDAAGVPVVTLLNRARRSDYYAIRSTNTIYTVGPDAHVREIKFSYCGYCSTGLLPKDYPVLSEPPWNGAKLPERNQNG